MGGPLKLKFVNHFIIYQKRPLRGHLGLAGYTQSSETGELNTKYIFLKRVISCNFRKLSAREIYCSETDLYPLSNEMGRDYEKRHFPLRADELSTTNSVRRS